MDDAPEGFPAFDLPAQEGVFAPGYAPEEISEIARKLRKAAGLGDEPTGVVATAKRRRRQDLGSWCFVVGDADEAEEGGLGRVLGLAMAGQDAAREVRGMLWGARRWPGSWPRRARIRARTRTAAPRSPRRSRARRQRSSSELARGQGAKRERCARPTSPTRRSHWMGWTPHHGRGGQDWTLGDRRQAQREGRRRQAAEASSSWALPIQATPTSRRSSTARSSSPPTGTPTTRRYELSATIVRASSTGGWLGPASAAAPGAGRVRGRDGPAAQAALGVPMKRL